MSKQQSETPDEPQVSKGKPGKRNRGGDWEIWCKYNGRVAVRLGWNKWRRYRTYTKRNVAEKALSKFVREFHPSFVQYELRYKGKPV